MGAILVTCGDDFEYAFRLRFHDGLSEGSVGIARLQEVHGIGELGLVRIEGRRYNWNADSIHAKWATASGRLGN